MPETTLSDRALLRLAGEDIRGFLQGLVTQNMDAVQPGAPQWSALLTAQGKVLFDFLLWADGEDILVDCEREQADNLLRRLTIYRLRRPITITRIAVVIIFTCLEIIIITTLVAITADLLVLPQLL